MDRVDMGVFFDRLEGLAKTISRWKTKITSRTV